MRAAPFAFDSLVEEPARETAPAPESASVAAARAEGFAEGLRDGRAEREAEIAQGCAALAATLAAASASLTQALEAETAALKSAGQEFLRAFAARLATEREREAAVDILDRLLTADTNASAALFLSPQSACVLRDPLKAALAARGADDAVAVAEDPLLATGECRVVWRSSGVARRLDRALAEIDLVFARQNPPTENKP